MKKPKILIVDDKKANLIALERTLKDFDIEFVRALSGNEALTKTLNEEFALALVDVQMPEMDGFETVSYMRQSDECKYLPIIFISAIYTDDFYKIKGIKSGAFDFIKKPYVSELLRAKVKVFIDLYVQHQQQEELLKEIERKNIKLKEAIKKANDATKSKSLFLANMSHEIRTPMNGIIGTVEILKKMNLTPQQCEFLDIIELSGNNLLTIINDILDFSKIESGQIEIEKIAFNLHEELRKIVKMLEMKAKDKNIYLRLEVDSSVVQFVESDPVRLSQIIINLINNAIKFTNKGGVTIKVKPIIEQDDSTKVRFEIIDTGVGISKEGIKKLFKSFSQVDASTTRKYGGTGLGLSISKNLSELLGGEIGVESEEGEGSTFWFIIDFKKVVKKNVQIEEVKEDETIEFKKVSVLLAEDNVINQKVATFNIHQMGHQVDIADNGLIAVNMFKKKNYDIILMDIHMPKMDGLEATKEIRNIENERGVKNPIKIVAMTADIIKGNKEKYLNSGMNGFIGKPFDPIILKKWLK
ncbi:MAG: response regulator [Bacteroidota bacterium]|nr:response regulator [Bacteroidota bacterium]